ncbi:ankyrin [Ophiobolus disseminans]|uniref:Ankyrin n=1 Tax=Ophiobolus disseminans TaxID=1469910 RepID=A0A6A7AI97_9PLEO|nr:ankyrin [Ophiobolus disseminans]
MTEPLSAVLGIVKSTWRAVEFARNAYHARGDATQLWARTNDLYLLIEKIDSLTQEHPDAFDEDIILIVQKALVASNRTLDELARRCLKLGDRDDLTLWSQIYRPVSFTLSSESIQKFEQQLQTNIMSVQIAFFLLGRGEQQELTRRVKDLLGVLETAMDFIARNTMRTPRSTEVSDGLDSTLAALESLDECVEAATSTMTVHSILTASPQTLSVEENEAIESPLQRLASMETRAWSEVAERSSCSLIQTERSESINSIALIDAIKDHSRNEFHRLLDNNINVNGADVERYTPLMHTIFQHEAPCDECFSYMHKLLQLSVDADAVREGETALHLSVKHDNLEAAKALLKRGATIDASPPDTPLMLAVQSNKPAFVELFLAATPTPDVNVVDRDNWGLIHHATWQNRKDVLRILLKCNKTMQLNMDLDARCAMDWTPLMRLAENAERSKSVKLATMLLDYGADVNATDCCGCSALYYAVTRGTYTPQRDEFVRLLLNNGVETEAVQAKVSKGLLDRYPALKPEQNPAATELSHTSSCGRELARYSLNQYTGSPFLVPVAAAAAAYWSSPG